MAKCIWIAGDIDNPTVIADTGYYNGSAIKIALMMAWLFILKAKANNKTKDNEFRKKSLYIKQKQIFIFAHQGKKCTFWKYIEKRLKYRKYKCKGCGSCNYKNSCTSSVSRRTLQRWEHEDILESVYADTWNNNDIINNGDVL